MYITKIYNMTEFTIALCNSFRVYVLIMNVIRQKKRNQNIQNMSKLIFIKTQI